MKEEKLWANIREKCRDLKHRTVGTGLIVLVILTVLGAATFAWYVYQTSIKTTKVHMAAGTSTSLEISDAYDGEYSTSVDLSSIHGVLNPVSTDIISNGFQKATAFEDDPAGKVKKLAVSFGKASESDYIKTTLYVRTNGGSTGIYACRVMFDDNETAQLMATAMRVGYVIHEPGENAEVQKEHIFILSDDENPQREYNTLYGEEGYVLDSTKTDGSVVLSPALDLDAFVSYDKSTGKTKKGENAKKLFTLAGGSDGSPGTPVQIDVYFWLEGCDADCTESIGKASLENIVVAFAAF